MQALGDVRSQTKRQEERHEPHFNDNLFMSREIIFLQKTRRAQFVSFTMCHYLLNTRDKQRAPGSAFGGGGECRVHPISGLWLGFRTHANEALHSSGGRQIGIRLLREEQNTDFSVGWSMQAFALGQMRI